MKVNRQLIWDYAADLPADEEGFRRWYVARVLTRGGIDDIRGVGLDTIREYLPKLILPQRVREFWEWYFGVKGTHGDPDREATGGH